MQKVDFTWELIIADDCSTDGTREILIEYKKKYPDFIKLILQERNVGAAQNWFELITTPVSKYIAYFEGDDYWTDSYKLKKQVAFLEANPDYGLVHHDANYLFEKSGELIKNHHKTNKMVISSGWVYEELLENNNIYAPTVVFRADLMDHFKAIDEYVWKGFKMGDYFMWLTFSQHCKFHYIAESMAVYRVLEESASKTNSYDKAFAFLNSYFDIRIFFLKNYPVENLTFEMVEQWRLSASLSYAIKYRRYKEARYFASKLEAYDWRSWVKRLMVNFPVLFRYIQRKNRL